jgi:integrase
MESAAVDYELLPGGANPLASILRRRNFPPDLRPRSKKDQIHALEPEDFRRAVAHLEPLVLEMVLVAALAGLRWGELIALRTDEDVDLQRNRLSISKALYKRRAQTPKTEESIREIDMCPTVKRVLRDRVRQTGLAFSVDGEKPLLQGPWIKRRWRNAQTQAGIKKPIRWHDLRHQFVSLLITAGKHPKYIAAQAGHSDAGFTMKCYGHLFDTVRITPAEWWDDLLWPTGCPRLDRGADGEMLGIQSDDDFIPQETARLQLTV